MKFSDLGVIPEGMQAENLFWDFAWDASISSNFHRPNGLIRQYSKDDNVEHFITLLNQINYCGYSDWTVPSIDELKLLNTQPFASTPTSTPEIKSIDQKIFKHHQTHLAEIQQRDQANGGDVDPNYYPYLLEPYFWTRDRAVDSNSIKKTGMNDFVKYQHPSVDITVTENQAGGKLFNQQGSITGGQYHALRAVRYSRYQRLDQAGNPVEVSANSWACVKDKGPLNQRYSKPRIWTVLTQDGNYQDINLDKSAADTGVSLANNTNRCGHNDWRLPHKEEIIALKPMNSSVYFPNVASLSANKDYFWLNKVTGADDRISLWSHSDYLSSSQYLRDARSNVMLIREESTSSPDPTPDEKDCNSDSFQIAGHCYQKFDTAKTWSDAKAYCQANNSELIEETQALSLIDELVQKLSLTLGNTHYWLADAEIQYGRARALTYYGGWRAYNQQLNTSHPFICRH